ncbi:MAG: YqhA family protein [Thermomicrobiales bacterium]|nr:YqhA family protein [Thermomicrobiales bacterium]
MKHIIRNSLAGGRYFILLAVVGSLLSAVMVTIYGLLAVLTIAWHSITHARDARFDHYAVEQVSLEFISLIDAFLLATVLYIIALGLYELFIDDDLPVPDWLIITSLDELKDKLVGVVIVLIAVNFLGNYVESEGGIGILWLGLGAGAVIAALTLAFALLPRHDHGRGSARWREPRRGADEAPTDAVAVEPRLD